MFLRAGLIVALIFLTSLTFASPQLTENEQENQISIGEVHSYPLSLKEGEFVSILVSETGQDVIVSLLSPENLKLMEVNLSEGTAGFERLFFVAQSSGNYQIEISPTQNKIYDPQIISLPDQQQCSYKIRIELRRPAEQNDLLRALTLAQLTSAEDMHSDSLENQVNGSVVGFMNALRLSEESNDRYLEAKCHWKLAEIYYLLSQPVESIYYAEQALEIYRSIGNKKGIAEALNITGLGYDLIGEFKKGLQFCEQSYKLREEIDDIHGQAESLHNIGVSYYRIGEIGKALENFNRIVPM
ncbi:MAG TPA: tetratricopeptide repeat protein, partial [Acidobacteriota bacterium]|nr:tetratricopeptide repeat protein [Acidobacteriota bacterium]